MSRMTEIADAVERVAARCDALTTRKNSTEDILAAYENGKEAFRNGMGAHENPHAKGVKRSWWLNGHKAEAFKAGVRPKQAFHKSENVNGTLVNPRPVHFNKELSSHGHLRMLVNGPNIAVASGHAKNHPDMFEDLHDAAHPMTKRLEDPSDTVSNNWHIFKKGDDVHVHKYEAADPVHPDEYPHGLKRALGHAT